MKNTLEAIKYGLETLKVSPKELFTLIESSNGYDGDNYKRWLANEIIKIAEKDDIGYSLLLAKWFNLIQGIIEEYADDSLRGVYSSKISEILSQSENVFTVGFSEGNPFGTEVQDVDWYEGVDLPFNYDFINTLPEAISNAILNSANTTFFVKLSHGGTYKKSSSLLADSKLNRVPVRNVDALMLYRMCNMAKALDGVSQFKFVFIVNTEFLYSVENKEIIDYFLSLFKYDGFVVSSKELYEGSFTSEDYAICSCTFRGIDDSIQNGFILPRAEEVNGEIVISSKKKRYSQGGNMLSYLFDKYKPCLEDTVPLISRDFKVVGKTNGLKKSYGYLCKGLSDRCPVLSSYPLEDTDYIAITKENLLSVIAYYGISVSMDNTGLFSDISELIDGHPEYVSLVSNCLPVFLFDVNSKFCDMGIFESKSGKQVHLVNKFDVSSDLVKVLLDKYSVYFGYEAKELIDVCMSLIVYFKEHAESGAQGVTFEALREYCDDRELNNSYVSALVRCKDYISSSYKQLYT